MFSVEAKGWLGVEIATQDYPSYWVNIALLDCLND